ncbi:hypothetical protein C8J56DRAFT_949590 [Mycena floridula]|nr:hypothetical protein C8J56DRAFT_949590 [Mycena floridula]
MPASSTLYGRDPDLEFIVKCLLLEPKTAASKLARFVLLGPGGMGKTSAALKVMRDARLLVRFPEYYQAWFPCVQATSFSLLLDIIHSALDLLTKKSELRLLNSFGILMQSRMSLSSSPCKQQWRPVKTSFGPRCGYNHWIPRHHIGSTPK